MGGDEKELSLGGDEVDKLKATHEGNQFVKKKMDPRLTSERDVEENKLTHLPYRRWCPV